MGFKFAVFLSAPAGAERLLVPFLEWSHRVAVGSDGVGVERADEYPALAIGEPAELRFTEQLAAERDYLIR